MPYAARLEESGIKVGRVRYHASQPWPMPHSLMIGCYAEAKSFEIVRDQLELEDCRWFTRAETSEMLARNAAIGLAPGSTSPPPKGAIAHRLMRDWLDWDGFFQAYYPTPKRRRFGVG